MRVEMMGRRLILPALLAGICLLGCGSKAGTGVEAGPEGEVRAQIDKWAGYLMTGDVDGLKTIFDIAYWPSSPTALAWGDYTGANLSAINILVTVDGQNAEATFTLSVAGEGSMRIEWSLIDQGLGWKVIAELWTDLP